MNHNKLIEQWIEAHNPMTRVGSRRNVDVATVNLSPAQYDAIVKHSSEDQLSKVMHAYPTFDRFKSIWKSHEIQHYPAPDHFWDKAKRAWSRVRSVPDPTRSTIRGVNPYRPKSESMIHLVLRGHHPSTVIDEALGSVSKSRR